MKAICPICPQHCALEEGQSGLCRARKNIAGTVTAVNYGHLTSIAVDPVEKKPFRRWYPGKFILSVGSYGCNLHCPFCQNDAISQAGAEAPGTDVTPEALVTLAQQLNHGPRGNLGVAFTYNEPLVGYEYVRDAAKLLRQAGLKTALVTNGMICREPLAALLPYIDAMNIDLKGWGSEFYQWLSGDLGTVQATIAQAAVVCHVEVTTLIIPDKNDDEAAMAQEAAWLASLSPDLPLHISRFFPRFQMQAAQPTPVAMIERLCTIARKHLKYVYAGNC